MIELVLRRDDDGRGGRGSPERDGGLKEEGDRQFCDGVRFCWQLLG